ncbi:CoA transferase [Parasphingorhabdus halotolerans]|uniref:CoA transferase n=1 Tax=Parasphingorhabdus halotolerans TaxID=2725558 RepID=A0A6H2DLA4_9SPHN|nr:CoA transferase [Parasphingorhabdus halotolerans]QJB68763.1 CoA transferase [Parasphingorhabdus halotolerans]
MSCAINLPGYKSAAKFGEQLLAELGLQREIIADADHPALAWRRAGLLRLSGPADGPAQIPPLSLTTAVDGAMLALKASSNFPDRLPQNGALLLGERARLMDLQRAGRTSTGGHCRLLDAADGRIALNLARDDDWELLEAWLEEPASSWENVEQVVHSKSATALVERGIELGLPVAPDELREAKQWFEEITFKSSNKQHKKPLVVDLSSLWAGPLAGNLLHLMGADVIKVESQSRPDGARQGNFEFFNLLNAGKRCATLDFTLPEGRTDLKKLVDAADIVIEASRPRALRQLGIDAEQLLSQQPGKTWVRLTAYGAAENRIGFGDDIGVGAGLSAIMEKAWGKPCFVGDAIADPISGIYAALAVWTKWQQGAGCLLNLSMCDIVRHAMQVEDENIDWSFVATEWQNMAAADSGEFYPMRNTSGVAEELGASISEIMSSLC